MVWQTITSVPSGIAAITLIAPAGYIGTIANIICSASLANNNIGTRSIITNGITIISLDFQASNVFMLNVPIVDSQPGLTTVISVAALQSNSIQKLNILAVTAKV